MYYVRFINVLLTRHLVTELASHRSEPLASANRKTTYCDAMYVQTKQNNAVLSEMVLGSILLGCVVCSILDDVEQNIVCKDDAKLPAILFILKAGVTMFTE